MFKGEVTPKLLEDIIQYCRNNMIADGWMGEFQITPKVRDELMETSIEFKEVMDLIPYISRDTINCLTRRISSAISRDDIDRDSMDKIKLGMTLLSKQMEFIYKMEKDSGIFKDEAESRRKRKNINTDVIDLDQLEDLKDLLRRA